MQLCVEGVIQAQAIGNQSLGLSACLAWSEKCKEATTTGDEWEGVRLVRDEINGAAIVRISGE